MKYIFLRRLSISFLVGTQDNSMACNPKKCNELILCKKVAHDIDPVNNNITQVSCLKVLEFTLQSNHRCNEHIKVKPAGGQ